ncbi:GNAT family N-acetyltransferase [Pseudaestuariivita rosea]|uniref:GNAT family N-acetyltransferase n=1 Tax=Pseudaestuariivita rosea TaxID=2763263 RepID=UPI001ABADB63|nr:GNAT family N-acetyltransferase [Pseudaestuariivita rosea]
MTIVFRHAIAADVPAIIGLLRDDTLGKTREMDELAIYHRAFAQMQSEATNQIIVGDQNDRVIATYQITFILGLSLKASRRALIESVRVARDLRRQGIGKLMMQDAERRAREAGCSLIQLTTNQSRDNAHRFYAGLGFTPSHIGFKRVLSDPEDS